MPKPWPPKYKVVRELAAQFLQENGLAKKLVSVNHLSSLFNALAGVEYDPKVTVKFDEDIFSQAFSNASESSSFGSNGSHYAIPLQNFMKTGNVADSNPRRSSRRCVSPASDESVAVQHIYVRTSVQREKGGERLPMSIGIFDSLGEGGRVEDVEVGLPNVWKLTLPMQERERLFDFLGQLSDEKSKVGAAKRKRSLSLTEEDSPRDRTLTIEACKTRFTNGMERLCQLRRELVEVETDICDARKVLMKANQNMPGFESSDAAEAKTKRLVHYILDGESGVIDVGERDMIFADEFERGIFRDHLSEDDRHEDDVNKRTSMDYIPVRLNKVDFWLPVGVKAILTQHFSRLFNDSKIVRRIRDVFSEKRERCIMSREGLRMLAAGSLHNSGGSDEGTLFCVYFAWKALFAEVGLRISNEAIARGCPKSDCFRGGEIRLGLECYLNRMRRLRKFGVKHYGMGQDGGNRKGDDHLVKVIAYVIVDEDGNETVEKFCVDIDPCGKTSDEIAENIVHSMKMLSKYGKVMCVCLTGDAGGGGAVQTVFPKVKHAMASEDWSRHIRCYLHALNKCLERAINATFGPQGLGKNTCLQLVFAAMTMMKELTKAANLKLFDEYRKIVFNTIMAKEEWQEEAKANFKQKFNDWWTTMNGDDTDAQLELLNAAIRNVQLPVLTRWHSTLPSIAMILDKWVVIYFLAVIPPNRRNKCGAVDQALALF